MADAQTIEIDVRAIPTWERHPKIMALFDSLEEGGELLIRSDHEPRPLRAEFDRTRHGRYVWLQRMIAGDLWEVTLRRVHAAGPRELIGDFLRRTPLLADALPHTQEAFESSAVERSLTRNETIVEQGSEWEGFGIVREGTVGAIITSPLGREHALHEILPGEPFGEVGALDGGVTVARYSTLSQTAHVLLFPRGVVEEALRHDRAFACAMALLCAQRLRQNIERFSAQTSLPTIARVAAALLPHAGPESGLQPVLPTFKSVTQAQLATAAGTVKEVVSRVLTELEEGGAIEREGGHIVRVDREKLTQFATCL